jgi:Mn2+/Fe2+ NRAMP family transporter
MGPGIIWMTSAIATGELLLTPRIASLYGYTVLWIMVLAIALKALIAREIGRYAVVTGGSLLQGFNVLGGPRNWAVWVMIAPQVVVAVATIIGMVGATSSAIIILLPGGFLFWALVALTSSIALVAVGKYRGVEVASIIMSVAITVALVITAALLLPEIGELLGGLVPTVEGLDFTEVLPWVGFMMSGAAGLVWYSYWLSARGFGSARPQSPTGGQIADVGVQQINNLRGWIRLMTISTMVASALILILLIALLVLGAELLRPEGLVPQGEEITAVLSRLLGDVWGPIGAWTMVLAAFTAFWSTVIANLDGWTRMFTEGTDMLAGRAASRLPSPRALRFVFLVGLMGIVPAVLLIGGIEPVAFLLLAGTIEAIQIPFVAGVTLYLNATHLPTGLRPSHLTMAGMAGAVLFFLGFSAYYLAGIIGLV